VIVKGRGVSVIFSLTHFVAALATAFVMSKTAAFYGEPTLLYLVFILSTYCMQPVLGILADAVNRNTLMASTGCVFISLSYFLREPLHVAFCCGAGAAAFLVGSGLDVINTSDRKLSLLSLYLAPDVAGLCCGLLLFRQGLSNPLLPSMVLFVLAVFDLFISSLNRRELRSGNADLSFESMTDGRTLFCVAALFVAASLLPMLVIRQAMIIGIDSKALMAGVALYTTGKLLSGLFSDHLGIKKVALASACFAGVCSIVSVATHSAGFAYAGVFASSMLVPIIVWTATRLLAGTKGLALGMVNMLTGVSVLVIAAGEFTLGVMVMAVFVTVVAVFVTIAVNRTEHAH
jgi:hypothetical protein